jgi:hypothetical protein
MSEVERQLSLPSLYVYWLGIGYFRVVKRGGGDSPKFPSEFGCQGLSRYFVFFYEKSSLVQLAARSEDCGLDPLCSYAVARHVRR